MAKKKAGSTSKTNKDSVSKRLGVKRFGGQLVHPGEIIVRQKGSKFHPGSGTRSGNDFTIYSILSGKVEFKKKLGKRLVTVNG